MILNLAIDISIGATINVFTDFVAHIFRKIDFLQRKSTVKISSLALNCRQLNMLCVKNN